MGTTQKKKKETKKTHISSWVRRPPRAYTSYYGQAITSPRYREGIYIKCMRSYKIQKKIHARSKEHTQLANINFAEIRDLTADVQKTNRNVYQVYIKSKSDDYKYQTAIQKRLDVTISLTPAQVSGSPGAVGRHRRKLPPGSSGEHLQDRRLQPSLHSSFPPSEPVVYNNTIRAKRVSNMMGARK